MREEQQRIPLRIDNELGAKLAIVDARLGEGKEVGRICFRHPDRGCSAPKGAKIAGNGKSQTLPPKRGKADQNMQGLRGRGSKQQSSIHSCCLQWLFMLLMLVHLSLFQPSRG